MMKDLQQTIFISKTNIQFIYFFSYVCFRKIVFSFVPSDVRLSINEFGAYKRIKVVHSKYLFCSYSPNIMTS